MNKVKKSSLVRLNEEAINCMSVMLGELFKVDEDLKINHSKLASCIVTEFQAKHFEKAKPRLVLAHQDKKKHLKDAIEALDVEEIEATIKYLEKIKKSDVLPEKPHKN
jgi:hypothetical protein